MPEEISDEEALRRLRDFLCEVRLLLEPLRDRPRRVIPGRHHEAMRAAWDSLQPRFESALAALSPSTTSNIVPNLRLRGLLGPELLFKLQVFAHARDRYLDLGGARKGRSGRRRWWKRSRRRLRPAMGAADGLLVGLGAIVPGADAIRAYMAAVEAGMALRKKAD